VNRPRSSEANTSLLSRDLPLALSARAKPLILVRQPNRFWNHFVYYFRFDWPLSASEVYKMDTTTGLFRFSGLYATTVLGVQGLACGGVGRRWAFNEIHHRDEAHWTVQPQQVWVGKLCQGAKMPRCQDATLSAASVRPPAQERVPPLSS
jgi:hypothetical protein